MYRGLPCIYSSGVLASASLLSGNNTAMLRVLAVAMILFMISHSFYPHDRVLESQAWKKVVYAGGKAILFSLLNKKSFDAIWLILMTLQFDEHVPLVQHSEMASGIVQDINLLFL